MTAMGSKFEQTPGFIVKVSQIAFPITLESKWPLVSGSYSIGVAVDQENRVGHVMKKGLHLAVVG